MILTVPAAGMAIMVNKKFQDWKASYGENTSGRYFFVDIMDFSRRVNDPWFFGMGLGMFGSLDGSSNMGLYFSYSAGRCLIERRRFLSIVNINALFGFYSLDIVPRSIANPDPYADLNCTFGGLGISNASYFKIFTKDKHHPGLSVGIAWGINGLIQGKWHYSDTSKHQRSSTNITMSEVPNFGSNMEYVKFLISMTF